MPIRTAARPGTPHRVFDTGNVQANLTFARASDAPLIGGNKVRVLRDATENYPAWEAAIAAARQTVHVEMYIIHRDRTGRWFVNLLAAKAREGVKVRLVYDWFGCGIGPALGLFRPLIAAGGEVRPFNRPSWTTVLGWTRRDHRKLITVDGHVTFISGLCLGDMWVGRPDRPLSPWRDTGVEIVGPAVTNAEQAFADSWRLAGGSLDPVAPADAGPAPAAGDVDLRLITTEPFTASMLRTDLLVAAMARRRLWITDAYFLGHGPFGEALRRAALGGVDVRMLLPQGSDVGLSVSASRTLYRMLIESGVRIFEWNGSMVHAKTAIADSRWARVGSTNLNVISWLGNWELDVAIEDEHVARTLEEHFLEDLEQSTEIVLAHSARRTYTQPIRPRERPQRSARRVVRTMTGLSRSIGAAVTGSRQLEDFEFAPLLAFGLVLIVLAALAVWRPTLLAWPAALIAAWTGLSLAFEAVSVWRQGRSS